MTSKYVLVAFPILTDLDNNNSGVYIDSSTVVTMSAAPSMLVLLLVALHLQSHHAKYYLVQTDGEAAGVSKKSFGNPKHVVSSSKTKASRVRRKNKKTGMVRRQDKKTSNVRHRNKEPGKVGRRNKALLHPVASGPLSEGNNMLNIQISDTQIFSRESPRAQR